MLKHKCASLILLLVMFHIELFGQTTRQTELFCGAELFYADINFLRLYDVRVNATPGVKIHLKNDWQVAGQVQIPLVNQGYAKRYNMVRLSMANVSKELHFNKSRQHLKITAGFFGQEHYGADIRWMYPIKNWLMVNARLGVASQWALGFDFKGNTESYVENDWAVFSILGVNAWLDKWNTEFRVSGGRYLHGDFGGEGEIARHFKHCTVSVFMQYHERLTNTGGTNNTSGGFRAIIMIPPYRKYNRKVVVRPASNFRLTYNAQSDMYSMKKYNTDPEENERTNAIHIPWGTDKFDE